MENRIVLQVLYCDGCRESCHPKRGPLAAHNLGPPRGSWQSNGGGGGKGSRGPALETTPACNDHNGEPLTLYCALCKIAICALCLRDRHAAHPHDVLPLAAACKAQKVSFFFILLSFLFAFALQRRVQRRVQQRSIRYVCAVFCQRGGSGEKVAVFLARKSNGSDGAPRRGGSIEFGLHL